MAIRMDCTCGRTLWAADREAGLRAVCPDCRAVHPVPSPAASPAAPLPAGGEVSAEGEAPACPVCADAVGPSDGVRCIACRTAYHAACRKEIEACRVAGCAFARGSRRWIGAPESRRLQRRNCPVCEASVDPRAERCPRCGEFLDEEMREAANRQSPSETSHVAGIAAILGVLGTLLLVVASRGSLILYAALLLLPLSSLGAGVWAFRDVARSRGVKRGAGMAGAGIGFSLLALLIGLFRLLFAFL